MKIGIFLNTQISATDSLSRHIFNNVEQVKAARDAGFDLLCAGEHFLSHPYQMVSTMPFLARMAADCGDMAIAATVLLLPLHNPVALAEEIATLDAMSGGRFILGAGLGYREEEFQAFGIKSSERVSRLKESLHIIKSLLANEEVEYQGNYYKIPRTISTIRTEQKPHPPIWMAANNNRAIIRAANWGYPWIINPHATIAMIDTQMDVYRETIKSSSLQEPEHLPLMREIHISETRGKAYEESRPYLEGKYAAYASWGQDKALPGEVSFSVPYEELARDRFLLGTSEDIVNEIDRYKGQLGVNYLIFRLQWPNMPHEETIRQIELLGKTVMPKIKD